MSNKIAIGLVTHAEGAHVGAYLQALAAAEQCGEVVLVDPDSRWDEEAERVLGDKLKHVVRDHKTLLREHRPQLVLVTMEAALAPPVIDDALDADCHVFAEKPACVRAEDFAPLANKADAKHRHLMLALANRINPEIRNSLCDLFRCGQRTCDENLVRNPALAWRSWFAGKPVQQSHRHLLTRLGSDSLARWARNVTPTRTFATQHLNAGMQHG